MSSRPTNPELPAIGHELAARRGWHPPPPSRGLAFVAGSVVVLTIAIVGAVFLVAPNFRRPNTSSAVSTTTLTSGEASLDTSARASIAPPVTAADDAPARANDVDEAKDAKVDHVETARSSRSRAAIESKAPSRASAKVRPAGPKAKPKAKAKPKPASKSEVRSAPEPTDDDLFSTPGTDVPRSPGIKR